jgi:hypothetical protein
VLAPPVKRAQTKERNMREPSYPVFDPRNHDQAITRVSLEQAQWLVASGGARWFRPRKLMLTNHKLYNIQRGGGVTIGPLHGKT